jgi:hypothetical protein
MRLFALAAAAVLAFGPTAQAQSELDNEKSVTNEQVQLSQDLPATLVVRVNEATNEVAVMHSAQAIEANPAVAAELAQKADFKAMKLDGSMVGELDRDSSKSSWYFCFPRYNYSYPTYSYFGYNYNYSNYYNYNHGGYRYSYYSWNYWGYNRGYNSGYNNGYNRYGRHGYPTYSRW